MSQSVERRKLDNRHFGMVVRDMENTLAYYAALGLDPMVARAFSLQGRLHGEPCAMNLRGAVSVGGNAQIEVVEPAPADIVHAASLAHRGEGGHHIGIFVNDLESELERWAKVGVEPLFRGATPDGSIESAYMDTAGIGGVVFELTCLAPGLAPRFEETSRSGTGFSRLAHVGVIVKDMDRTIAFYNTLGLGPFTLRQASVQNLWLAGRSGFQPLEVKLAYSQSCMLPIELVQPQGSGSIYHETLERQGEGIQHIACYVPDLAGERARLEANGVKLLMGNERFLYLDSLEVGGLIVELTNLSSQRPSLFARLRAVLQRYVRTGT